MKKANKYVIKTINDLVDVMDGIDDASFDNFCVDVIEWMAFTHMVVKDLRQKLGKQAEGKKASELMDFYFTWYDDGVTGIKAADVTKNGQTKRIKL
jgi:hypothetical protein